MADVHSNVDIQLVGLSGPVYRREPGAAEEDSSNISQSLEPVDKGRAAWRMLLSAFIFESLLWGFPLSFGVFQNHYSHIPEYANQRYVSVIGTVASGISYMGAPLIIPLLKRVHKYRTHMIWFGWLLCIAGILASSFAQRLPTLILTQGVLYGLGFVIFYYPIISMVNEFWIARRGMAYGVLCSASGVSGIVMPFSLQALLDTYGLSTTLRVVAVGLAVLTGPLVFFIKGRGGPASTQGVTGTTDWKFLRAPLFWIYSASNLANGLGYFFPALYLPSYASSLGLSSTMGALLLAIMSVSQVFGQLSFGYLSDTRVSVNTLVLVSPVVSAVAVLALWGMAKNLAVLCVFAIVYGFFAAGYTAMWARMGTAVTADSTAAFAAFGLFNLGKGLGNVSAGPISAKILTDSVHVVKYAVDRYEAVVLFSGSCMLASAAISLAPYYKHWKAASTQE